MLIENRHDLVHKDSPTISGLQGYKDEAVARFAARVRELGSLVQASPELQARLFQEVKTIARSLDGRSEMGSPSGYDRRVLYEVPGRWSLAAIILRPGQKTDQHDHGGWGCAVTVKGIERNRRFVRDTSGKLIFHGERDYTPGTGYIFDAADIHQPVGADPWSVTVAVHLLVHENQKE
jgi:predicted metal-dependent enzyme (double-stranded beta helix superfamily)